MKVRSTSILGPLADPSAGEFLTPVEIGDFGAERSLGFLKSMRRIRSVEERIAEWAEAGIAKCPCHLSIGQEAVAVGVAHALRDGDRLFGNHRSHAHYLARGGDTFELLAEVLGREAGCAKGMGGSMHLISRSTGFLGSVPIVGGTIPIAVGAALAAKMDGGSSISVAFFGDGSCEEGVFHESLNLARVYDLPILFVCENNLFSSHLDIALRQPSDSVSRFAVAHDIRSAVIDGNDVTGVARAATSLVDQIRNARQPAFLEAVTYRWRGHVGPKEDIDVGVRRSLSDLAAWKARDPIARLERGLARDLTAAEGQFTAIAAAVREEVEEAARRAIASPFPTADALLDRVYPSRQA